MKIILLPRPVRPLLTLALLGLFGAQPCARAQSDTGGTGTIDPNTVALHELINDASIIRDSHETIQARYLATDAAGNVYTGATAVRSDTVYPVSHSTISKYSPGGVLLWQRERMVDYSIGTSSETFSPDQPPVGITGEDASSVAVLAALEVDAAGNVTVGYNTLNVRTDDRTSQQTLNASGRNLIVRFDPDGKFLWRSALGVETLGAQNLPYYHGGSENSGLATLRLLPDGSVAALLDDRARATFSGPDHEATVLVRLAAADGSVTAVSTFGTFNDQTNAIPLTVTLDGAGNAYLLSYETAYADGTGPLAPATNVIRKLNAAGSVLGQVSYVYPDAANNGATEDWADAQADASGNLYVAAAYRRNRTNATSGDGQAGQVVRAYNPDLTLRWRVLGPQPAQTGDEQPIVQVRSLRLSPGGITVGGTTKSDVSFGANGDQHGEITRYAYADGGIRWHRLFQGPAVPNVSRGDGLGNLQVDARDNVYGLGVLSAAPRNHLVFLKYSAVGDLQFIKVLPDFDSGDQSFQLLGGSVPALVSAVPELAGKTVVVETVDNPAVVPATGGSHPAFFSGEVALGSGAYYLQFPGGNPFGYYSYLTNPKYIFHFDLGYEYVFDANDSRSGVYLYDFKSNGFFYTSPSFPFPYLYDFSLNSTVYYYPDPGNPGRYNTNGFRFFYVFNTGQIISK